MVLLWEKAELVTADAIPQPGCCWTPSPPRGEMLCDCVCVCACVFGGGRGGEELNLVLDLRARFLPLLVKGPVE